MGTPVSLCRSKPFLYCTLTRQRFKYRGSSECLSPNLEGVLLGNSAGGVPTGSPNPDPFSDQGPVSRKSR